MEHINIMVNNPNRLLTQLDTFSWRYRVTKLKFPIFLPFSVPSGAVHVNIGATYDSPGNESLQRDVVLQWDVSTYGKCSQGWCQHEFIRWAKNIVVTLTASYFHLGGVRQTGIWTGGSIGTEGWTHNPRGAHTYIHVLLSASKALQIQPLTWIFSMWNYVPLITDIHSKRLPFPLTNYKHTPLTHTITKNLKHLFFLPFFCPFTWFCDPYYSSQRQWRQCEYPTTLSLILFARG